MNEEDWANVIRVMRSAPLPNMAAAESIAALIKKVAKHADQQLELQEDICTAKGCDKLKMDDSDFCWAHDPTNQNAGGTA